MNIIDAADANDSDDVEIRQLLVAALRDSDLDLVQIVNGQILSRRTSCKVGTARRAGRTRSPYRRRSPLVAGQTRRP
jgi:hypothetical protein